MELTKHRISLDIHRQTTQAHLAVKKGDTARQILVSLVSGGAPYSIADGCYAVFMAKKPDGNILYNDCAIEGNQIIYAFTEQTASAAGLMACELRLYGSNGNLITSPKIAIIVSGTVYEDSEVESTDEFSALSKLVTDVQALQADFPNALPNPQALTINGQVYDGSTPIGVETGFFLVVVSSDGVGGYKADKTLEEIDAAYAAGRPLCCQYGTLLPLMSTYISGTRTSYCFEGFYYFNCLYQVKIDEDGVSVSVKTLAYMSDIPRNLPNPQTLTINGQSYDGSEAVNIEISGGSGEAPHIGDNGNWWIGEEDTGVKAAGEDGRSVYSVELDASQSDEGKSVYSMTDDGDRTIGSFMVYHGKDGSDYVLTDADKAEIAEQTVAKINAEGIPEYWESHLAEKADAIRSLQEAGGMECASFIVMTDMHIDGNLAQLAPVLAKRLMKQCDIKYALCLGDVFTREVKWTKDEADAHYAEIEEMLSPIRDRLLQTQGNHDGTYGAGDWDGDGDTDTYLYNFTPSELFQRIYRKVGMVGQVHFDPAGSNAYYIDDAPSRIRYVILNTHCTAWELDENGHAKYNSMRTFRYTQTQYDFLSNDALATVPDDYWGVVIASHVPINHSGEMPEGEVMEGLLNAYKEKTAYAGTFAGTGESESKANFTNLNDTAGTDFLDNCRFYSGSDASADPIIEAEGFFVSTYIPASCPGKVADLIRIAGLDTTQIITAKGYDADKNVLMTVHSTTNDDLAVGDDGVITWKAGYVGDYVSTANANALAYIRISGRPLVSATEVVITKNEEINYTEGEHPYDYVSVDVDFSGAKGELVGYFGGHVHADKEWNDGFPVITTRCDAVAENTDELKAERVAGTVTEQSFDVFTVNKKTHTIYATKIGAGADRIISY